MVRLQVDTYTAWRIAYNINISTGLDSIYEQFIAAHDIYEFDNDDTNHFDIIVDVLAALLAYSDQDYLFDMPPDQVATLGALGNNAASLLAPYLYGLAWIKNNHCESELPAL